MGVLLTHISIAFYFLGHMQTLQTQISASDQGLHCLLTGIEMKRYTPKIGNGLVQFDKDGQIH